MINTTMSFHPDYYLKIDPDTLYTPGSETIIYTRSGDWFHDKYPVNHRDLLENDWDAYVSVYEGDPEKQWPEIKAAWHGRPAAAQYAILARFAFHHLCDAIDPQEGEAAVLATWNSESHPLFKPFIRAFLQRMSAQFPPEKLKNKIVVTTGHAGWKHRADKWEGSVSSKLLAEYMGDRPEEIKKNIDPEQDMEKTQGSSFQSQYRIGSRIYTPAELFDMIKRVHTRPWEWEAIKSIWCHPDIDKFPELRQIKPSKCSPRRTSSGGGRPRLSDYVRKSYEIGAPLPAGIGGTSESTLLGFEDFYYEKDFVDHPDLLFPSKPDRV